MPRRRAPKAQLPTWTPNQIVAANLTRLRHRRSMTQAEAAFHLSQFSGVKWTEAMVAHAERSVTGNRIREFTADDLVTMARAFNVPVLYFLTPPFGINVSAPDKPVFGITTVEMFEAVLGRMDNLSEWEALLDEWDFVADEDEVPLPLSEEKRTQLRATAREVALIRAHHLIRKYFKGDLNDLRESLYSLSHLVGAIENHEALAEMDDDEYIKELEELREVSEKGRRLSRAQKAHEDELLEFYRTHPTSEEGPTERSTGPKPAPKRSSSK